MFILLETKLKKQRKKKKKEVEDNISINSKSNLKYLLFIISYLFFLNFINHVCM